jgi:hypothetical protein
MRLHRAMLLVAGFASLSCSDAPTIPTPQIAAVADGPDEIIVVDKGSRSFDLAAGNQHSCATSFTLVLHCWGSNSQGQAPAFRGPPTGLYFQVSAGTGDNTCALRIDFTVECFGKNDLGQSPGVVTPGDYFYVQVDAGKDHACGLRFDGAIECWGGQNDDYAPPFAMPESGGFWQISAGDESTCALTTDGEIECGGVPGIEEGFSIAPRRFKRMSVGKHFVCAIHGDAKKISCRGANGFGQAPLLRTAASSWYIDVAAGELHTCALRHDGIVECWGDNAQGQAPATRLPGPGGRYVRLAAGAFHNCALRQDTSIDCWGDNANGKLNAPPLKNVFKFRGFFGSQLTAPGPNDMNHVVLYSGGRNMNIKFGLGSNEGMGVIAAGYPQVATVNCNTPAKLDAGAPVSGNLSFAGNEYTYAWNVSGTLSNSCRQFILKLTDGTYHRVNFHFSGPPVAVVKVLGGSANTIAGAQVSPTIVVKAVDAFGTGIAEREITFSVIQGGGNLLEPATVRTDWQGFAIVPAWAVGPPGPQKLRATFVAVSGTFILDLVTNSIP